MSRTGGGPVLTVHLMGGLGNQMFQYAFGRCLSLANSASLVLDATGYGQNVPADPSQGIRICELSRFRIVGTLVEGKATPAAAGRPAGRWIRKAHQMVLRWLDLRKPYYLRSEIVEPRSGFARFDRRVLERRFSREVGTRGFWQSETYFLQAEKQIRAELTPRESLRDDIEVTARAIRRTESVGVHVRHGDNATSVASELGVLPPSYYDRAVSRMRHEFNVARFYVFSDDKNWARQLLSGQGDMAFVGTGDAVSAFEDMWLLAQCKHHIIANSTFGWWGAWLGKKPGQVVYAPKRYYQNVDRPNPDLYPPAWRLI